MITLQYCDGCLPYSNVNWSQVCLRVVLSGQGPLWGSALSLGEPHWTCGPVSRILLAVFSHSGSRGSVREDVNLHVQDEWWMDPIYRQGQASPVTGNTEWESSLLGPAGGASAMASDAGAGSGWRREVLWLPLITPSSVGATAGWAVMGVQKFCWEQDSFFHGRTNSQGVLLKTKQVFLCHWRLEGAQEWGSRQKQCYRWVKMKRIPSAEKATDTAFFFFFKLSAARRACAFFNWRPLETFPTIKSSTPWNVADLCFHVALDFWSPLQKNNAKPTDTEGLFLSWWYPFAPRYYVIFFLQSIVKFN